MLEISLEYWNTLASQTITISSLLGGFSIAVVANILVSDSNNPLIKNILIAAAFAACAFLVTLFSMTKMVMMTSTGYPFEIVKSEMDMVRTVGVLALLIGITSLIIVVALAGWTKSKKTRNYDDDHCCNHIYSLNNDARLKEVVNL